LRPLALVLAIVIAYCLSAVGEAALNRWSRTLAEWNMAFLVGLSLTSTVFFPLSWLFKSKALNMTAVGLILIGIASAVRRVIAGRGGVSQSAHASASAVQGMAPKLLLALLMLVVAQFAVQNYRLVYLWDGYQIWATKALVLFHRGAMTQNVLTPHEPDLVAFPNCCDGAERVAAYPQTVPLFEALVVRFEGQFNWEALKAIFPFFFVSLLISTFEASLAFVRPVAALAACLLLAFVPAVSAHETVGGYADMPEAALLAGVLAALFLGGDVGSPSYRQPAPWVLGGLLLVKSEGAILLGVACAAIALVWASRGWRDFLDALRRYSGAITVVATCAVLRALYLEWMDTKDLTYGPIDKLHLVHAYQRLWQVPEVCAHYMLDRSEWGVFWPVFFLAVPIVLWKGAARERALTCGALAVIAAYNAIFYFTNWTFRLHIEQAYTRLLVQLAPAAALVTVVGYQYLAGGRLAGADAISDGRPVNARRYARPIGMVVGALLLVALVVFVRKETARPVPARMTIPPGQLVTGFEDQVEGKPIVSVARGAEIHVSGWAGCANAAAPLVKVEVIVDDTPEASATLSFARPDVAAAFGRVDFANSGWKASFGSSGISNGTHVLIARATCADGKTGTLPPFQLVLSAE
jgi:hypothetical protein